MRKKYILLVICILLIVFLFLFYFLRFDVRKDWKIYSHPQEAFSMQYPPSWIVNDSPENRSTFGSDIAFNGPDQRFIGIAIDTTNQSLDEWQASLDQSIIEDSFGLMIDGQPARGLAISEFGQQLIGTRCGDKFYVLRFQDTGIEKQIISTFRFLR